MAVDLLSGKNNNQTMSVDLIQKLASCEYGKHFLTRSYSLELMYYLLENKKAEGIEDLLQVLHSATPRLPAFLSYISLLEAKGCINKTENESKRSQRTITLTKECEEAIRRHIG